MGILKDVGESIVKIGGIVVDKTEEYTKIAKLTLVVKRCEGEIEKVEAKIGKIVFERYEKNESMIEFTNTDLTILFSKIDKLKTELNTTKTSIEELKKEKAEKKTPDSEDK